MSSFKQLTDGFVVGLSGSYRSELGPIPRRRGDLVPSSTNRPLVLRKRRRSKLSHPTQKHPNFLPLPRRYGANQRPRHLVGRYPTLSLAYTPLAYIPQTTKKPTAIRHMPRSQARLLSRQVPLLQIWRCRAHQALTTSFHPLLAMLCCASLTIARYV